MPDLHAEARLLRALVRACLGSAAAFDAAPKAHKKHGSHHKDAEEPRARRAA